MGQRMTRGEIQDLLAKFAVENPRYREALINDAKGLIEKQLNTSLGSVKVEALVETAETAYVIVPYVPADGELSDKEIEKVAGGFLDKNAECTVATPGRKNTFTQINL